VEQVKLPQGTVHYRDTGSGPPIVFVHGLLVNGTLWRDVVPALEDRFRCVVPDLPLGSHGAAMDPSADLTPPGLAALVEDFMAALDLRDVTLVGNDTGGAICQIVAANHPGRLARMVLTPCDMYDDFLPLMFRPLQWIARVPGGVTAFVQPTRIAALHNTPLAFGLLAKRPIDRERTRGWLRPALSDADVRRDARKVLRGIDKRHTLDAAERLRGFERPTLFAWAADDRVFKLDNAERLAATMPDARVVEIEDSYSFVPIDQPGRTASLIGDFATGGGSPARGSRQGVA
jgi:pimeloyl-ACP methyl ester carboxylesterase